MREELRRNSILAFDLDIRGFSGAQLPVKLWVPFSVLAGSIRGQGDIDTGGERAVGRHGDGRQVDVDYAGTWVPKIRQQRSSRHNFKWL